MRLSSLCLAAVLAVGFSPLPVMAQETPGAVAAPVAPPESSKLNLEQRRIVKEFQTTKLPDLTKNLQAAAGFAVEVTLDWDSICEPDYAHMYIEAWTNQFFLPMTEALKKITKDEMGKTALKGKLKKIHFCNLSDTYNKEKAVSFEGGILKYDHKPATNLPSFTDGKGDSNFNEAVDAINKLLEKNL